MIIAVTLNPSIDKTYYLDRFKYSEVSRVQRMHSVPGGKGINVARVIHQLGGDVISTGFIGGKNGEFIESELHKRGMNYDFIQVDGESRVCLNIVDESNGTSTELLEPGPTLSDKNLEQMRKRVRYFAEHANIMTFSGSLPLGVSSTFYAALIEIAKAKVDKVFLDTSGDALLGGIQAKPFLIKPNQDEVKKILSDPMDEDLIFTKITELIGQGITCVVVSLGPEGAIAGYQGSLYRIKAPLIEPVSTVGCGDAFIAGFAVACDRGDHHKDCFRLATAVAAASALTSEAGTVRIEDVKRLISQVEVQELK